MGFATSRRLGTTGLRRWVSLLPRGLEALAGVRTGTLLSPSRLPRRRSGALREAGVLRGGGLVRAPPQALMRSCWVPTRVGRLRRQVGLPGAAGPLRPPGCGEESREQPEEQKVVLVLSVACGSPDTRDRAASSRRNSPAHPRTVRLRGAEACGAPWTLNLAVQAPLRPSLAFAVCKMGCLPRTATRSWHQGAVTEWALRGAARLRRSVFSATCLHLLGQDG